MLPRRDPLASPMLTRRALASRLAAGAAAIGIGSRAKAAPRAGGDGPGPARCGPARLCPGRSPRRSGRSRGGQAAVQRLAETDPEGALLYRLYRALDVRLAAWYRTDMPDAATEDLMQLPRRSGPASR